MPAEPPPIESIEPSGSRATEPGAPDRLIVPSEAELRALVGHRFPGGTYRIAHWESWLLNDCTGREPLPDRLVHPIALFHAPILGARTSIAELFALGRASGDSGSVGLLGYDWEYLAPLREEVEYRVQGGIVAAERHTAASGAVDDRVAFSIELSDGDALVARVTNRWSFRRSAGVAGRRVSNARATDARVSNALVSNALVSNAPATDARATDDDEAAGTPIPPWEMPFVDPARMKTMAALLRDPYPVHWDRTANERLGLGGRVVNQGPLNLGYVANMLMAWAGPASIRRLTVSFGAPVLDGERVVARGVVRERVGDEARCDVWLERDGERVVSGTAVVAPAPLDAR